MQPQWLQVLTLLCPHMPRTSITPRLSVSDVAATTSLKLKAGSRRWPTAPPSSWRKGRLLRRRTQCSVGRWVDARCILAERCALKAWPKPLIRRRWPRLRSQVQPYKPRPKPCKDRRRSRSLIGARCKARIEPSAEGPDRAAIGPAEQRLRAALLVASLCRAIVSSQASRAAPSRDRVGKATACPPSRSAIGDRWWAQR